MILKFRFQQLRICQYSQVQRERGGGGAVYFFVIFVDPPGAYFDRPFINFSNFMGDYTEVHKIDKYIRLLMIPNCKRLCNILETPMLNKV